MHMHPHMNERDVRDVSFSARMLFHLASCVWGRDNYRKNLRVLLCLVCVRVLEIFMRDARWLIIRNGPGRVEQSPPAGLLVN